MLISCCHRNSTVTRQIPPTGECSLMFLLMLPAHFSVAKCVCARRACVIYDAWYDVWFGCLILQKGFSTETCTQRIISRACFHWSRSNLPAFSLTLTHMYNSTLREENRWHSCEHGSLICWSSVCEDPLLFPADPITCVTSPCVEGSRLTCATSPGLHSYIMTFSSGSIHQHSG